MQTERIISGPDRWELIGSFIDREGIEFTIEGGRKIGGIVSSIQHEDGSGKSFILILSTLQRTLRVYYNADSRTGHVKRP
ncbi:MAG TPA: hypothetical protein PK476_03105 [Candidatus Pacearchaeota archaeon]|nr:hypothetical protein [Candidatus Pacearchaeota archaeon]HQM24863.1 hypothetical protein [Candidatus Pacearchaeota archaeon]